MTVGTDGKTSRSLHPLSTESEKANVANIADTPSAGADIPFHEVFIFETDLTKWFVQRIGIRLTWDTSLP